MPVQTPEYLKDKFQDTAVPTGADYADLIDSTIGGGSGGSSEVVFKLDSDLYGLTIPTTRTVADYNELEAIPQEDRVVGEFVETLDSRMVYCCDRDKYWTQIAKQFSYRFITAGDGSITDNGTPVADLSGAVVGDWHKDDLNGGANYVFTPVGSWNDTYTNGKDWSLPIYQLGSNDETILYVYDGNKTGILFSPLLSDLATQPTGKKISIQADSGPNGLYINFGVCDGRNVQLHSFDNDPSFTWVGVQNGITMNYGVSISFTQNRSIEDGDTEAQWVCTSGQFTRGNSNFDGFGNNPALNVAGNAYNRFTLSEAQYNWLTTTSGIN